MAHEHPAPSAHHIVPGFGADRAAHYDTQASINLAGYQAAHLESGVDRVTVGGLTDQGFRMLDLLDRRARGDWPF